MEKAPFLDGDRGQVEPSRWTSPFPQRNAESPRSKLRFGMYALAAAAGLMLVMVFVGLAFVQTNVVVGQGTGVYNATFGFGAIILMSLPERTDRRDGMSLIASTSGIQITKTIDATRGEDIPEKARPFGKGTSDKYLGSWRTHMDALKYVVDNNIQTALLFEDDVDWDVRIKPQLEAFSNGLRDSPFHNASTEPVSLSFPYGNDWDIMHLGCLIIKQAPPPYEKIHASYVDPDRMKKQGCSDITEPNTGDPAFCWGPMLENLGVPEDSRAILPSYHSIGLPAIAVTYEGAQRILYELSWKSLDNTLDWGIHKLLRAGRIRGLTVLPPLFGMYKIGDAADSDLVGVEGDRKSPIEGHSEGIERSVRLALNEEFGGASRGPSRWSRKYWAEFGINV